LIDLPLVTRHQHSKRILVALLGAGNPLALNGDLVVLALAIACCG
jgi:hypothetical protein